jgi:hypothetical protein
VAGEGLFVAGVGDFVFEFRERGCGIGHLWKRGRDVPAP